MTSPGGEPTVGSEVRPDAAALGEETCDGRELERTGDGGASTAPGAWSCVTERPWRQ